MDFEEMDAEHDHLLRPVVVAPQNAAQLAAGGTKRGFSLMRR